MIPYLYADFPGNHDKIRYLSVGESIVWQCSSRQEFQDLVLPYTILNNTDYPVTYLCFGEQLPYPVSKERVSTYYIEARDGFESFTYQAYSIITAAPAETLFVFDFLSELQTSWVSDTMTANFFRIICPILAQTGSSGFFPIIRGQHSCRAIRNIRKNADKFMDIQQLDGYLRILPLRPPSGQKEKEPVTYYHITGEPLTITAVEKPAAEFTKDVINRKSTGIWNRYFETLKVRAAANNLPADELPQICGRLMTQEERMKNLIVKYFAPADYLHIFDREIGAGQIGGKACGFLIGRKLLETNLAETADYLEPQDTYFIGTDVFYSYMVENDCWPLRLRHRLEQEEFDETERYKEKLAGGVFMPAVRKQFLNMLLHYGNTPIIIRSSSFLEDGYGNAFSGKYESVFCANQGSLKKRLYALEDAIRRVYVSTLAPSALEYRKKRKLLGQDEQMALLVQRVSGTKHGDFYFPMAAGVSFSYNPYRWMEHINPEAGMSRLVAGLGTRAVNRTPGDYPRLVSLDRPQAKLWPNTREQHKFSQRYVDVLNLTTGEIEAKPCHLLMELLSPAQQHLLFSHDTDAEEFLHQQGRYRQVFFTDCQGIINNTRHIAYLKQALSLLEQEYDCPVDIEYALSLKENGDIGFDLLQCRPLQHHKSDNIAIRQHLDTEVLFEIKQASMRNSKEEAIDMIVLVDPRHYYETPYHDKAAIAAIIGKVNKQIETRNTLLLVPGRIGTSSPELGVPVTYAEVSQFKAICEVAYSAAGYNPELSYGSHMFQDLVEADVFYAAIHENRNTRFYQPELLNTCPDLYPQMFPLAPEHNDTVHIYDLSESPATLYLDAADGHAICIMKK